MRGDYQFLLPSALMPRVSVGGRITAPNNLLQTSILMPQNSTSTQDDHSEVSGSPELLAEMFLLSISGTYLRADTIHLTISSVVCALWRQIALDLAALWATIIWVYFVKWTSTDDGTSRESINWIQLCLTRSRNAPLDIYVAIHNFKNGSSGPFDIIREILPAQQHRWRHVYLDVPERLLQVFLTFLNPFLSRVTLTLKPTGNGDYPSPITLLDPSLTPHIYLTLSKARDIRCPI